MSRPAPLSGFPEWLPAQRIVEQRVLDDLRRTFELHGFGSVETRAVEPLEQLTRKGDIQQEVYVLRRLQAGEGEGDKGLGLHFDLTVPFARYVLENAGHLEFPYRRYQIQKAWRGERPQEGRYREFVQADIDVVDRDTLPFHYDVEVAVVVAEALRGLPVPPVTIQVNNRRLAEGFFRGVGADDPFVVLRAVDKLDKVGPDTVLRLLVDDAGLTDAAARQCLALASIRTPDTSFVDRVRALGVSDPLLDQGLDELVQVVEGVAAVAPGLMVADLRIARGLDYYTGTVYETQLRGHEDLGSICSGGRYDALASDGRTTYPGVGVSIGVTRMLGRVLGRGLVEASRSVPTCVLVAVDDEDARAESDQVAAALRARGIACEVAPSAARYGKQIRHADRRGIPYVWFPGDGSVRDIRTGEQLAADPGSWQPPAADLAPTVRAVARPSDSEEQTPVIRTHEAGTLRATDAGATVTLAGWVAHRRDHGGVAFLDLRDSTGLAQVVVRDAAVAHGLRAEYCLKVVGEVALRPEGNANPDLPSGEVEVLATVVDVLSESAPLPFPLDEHVSVGEEARLRYRYLDLRRPGPAAALRMRSEVNRLAREVLLERRFVEVETPTLTRSTPEGARDFLVPVRLQPGHWYALPQSPQLFKQLLMVAGVERYFQIARCYRDEDFRKDRQPEFTQLDIEMSFVDQDDVVEVGEAVVRALWRGIVGHELDPVPRMTYAEAMTRFGTDKPDLRFGVELVDLTAYFASTPFRVFQAEHVGAVVMPGGADQPRRAFDAWQDWARQRGAKGLAYVTFGVDGELGGPVAKNLSDDERAGLRAAVGAEPGDCAFFAAGSRAEALALLGATRLEVGERCGLVDAAAWSFVWVVDAPMFEKVELEGGGSGWTAVHHPFTSPNDAWADRFQDAPGEALAWAYDIVCNGNEIGGGSIRIHRAEMQQRVFDVLGMSREEARDKFGFLLDAFAYGPPPHGGIAFGWDRICMLLAGAPSLRDVIAFPKTGAGYDPLTGAPTPITPAQRAEAGVDADPTPG